MSKNKKISIHANTRYELETLLIPFREDIKKALQEKKHTLKIDGPNFEKMMAVIDKNFYRDSDP